MVYIRVQCPKGPGRLLCHVSLPSFFFKYSPNGKKCHCYHYNNLFILLACGVGDGDPSFENIFYSRCKWPHTKVVCLQPLSRKCRRRHRFKRRKWEVGLDDESFNSELEENKMSKRAGERSEKRTNDEWKWQTPSEGDDSTWYCRLLCGVEGTLSILIME